MAENSADLAVIKHNVTISSDREAIDIVLLTYNRLDYFKRTVTALVQNTRYPYRLIVVDNNSAPEMQQFLQAGSSSSLFDQLIINEDNYHTAAFQRGIAVSRSDPYIVSDPDILVPDMFGECWLERLVTLHSQYPEIGLIALNLDPINKPAKLADVYLGEKIAYNDEITLCNVGTVMQAIKRRYFDGCYLTDWETCQQIRENGGKVGYANQIVAYHLGWDEDRDYPDYLLGKYAYYRQKYGAETYRMYTENEELLSRMKVGASDSDYYGFSRPDVQLLVNPAAKRILDIGCASGMLGFELKQKTGAEIWGVEYSPQAAGLAAKRLDRVLTGRVEMLLNELPKKYFDTIIMADLLEHLVEPERLLESLHEKLTVGGEIVVSIPNVRHWSVLKQLLEGGWEYSDAGILDRTHLRFFTYSTALRLLEKSGYSVTRTEAIQMRGDELIPPEVTEVLGRSGINVSTLSEESGHYQYLFVASSALTTAGGDAEDSDCSRLEMTDSSAEAVSLTSIIILTWNGLHLTKACLASIAEFTPEPYELIIVDNGSTDGTLQWLRQQAAADHRIRIIANESNKGFAAGCNQGMRAATGDYLLLLNNDTVVTPGWLSGMREVLDRYPEAGIIGPMTNSASGIQVVPEAGYSSMAELTPWAESYRSIHRYRVVPCRRIVGFCMLFRRELTEKIGMLDESFGTGNYEDDDFCLRAELAGHRNLIAGDVFIHHEGGATFSGNNLVRGEENRNNRIKFRQKWKPAGLEESLLRSWLVLNAVEESDNQFMRSDIAGAVDTLLQKGIRTAPASALPYFRLMEILIAAGRFDDALQVPPEMPDDVDQYRVSGLKALCHCALGDNSATRGAAEHALGGSSGKGNALLALGTLAARHGNLKDADIHLNSAILADPSNSAPWLALGMLRWGSGDQEGAWQALRRSVAINPLNRAALAAFLDIAYRLSRMEHAEELIADSLYVWPYSRWLMLAHINILADSGKIEAALDAAESCLARFSTDDEALSLARALRQQLAVSSTEAVPHLSLCMIVKDEEKCLALCLNSLKSVVDEMIIVDTGSTDSTRAIAAAFGASVYDYDWKNNFSDARNFSISKARGRWLLIMDADEALGDYDCGQLRQLLADSTDKLLAFSVTTRNYTGRVESEGWQPNDGLYPFEEKGDGWYPSTKVRLFPAGTASFRGDIHEMLESELRELNIPIAKAPFFVHHYGELDETDRRVKQLRYYEAGKRKIEAEPGNCAAIAELAIQAGQLELYDEGLKWWDRLLAAGVQSRDLYFNRGYLLMGLKRFSEASEMALKSLEIDPDHKESAYNYGICLLNLARPEQALELVAGHCKRHPDYPLLMALLCVLYLAAGNVNEAELLHEKLKNSNYQIDGYTKERIDLLRKLGHLHLAGLIAGSSEQLGKR